MSLCLSLSFVLMIARRLSPHHVVGRGETLFSFSRTLEWLVCIGKK